MQSREQLITQLRETRASLEANEREAKALRNMIADALPAFIANEIRLNEEKSSLTPNERNIMNEEYESQQTTLHQHQKNIDTNTANDILLLSKLASLNAQLEAMAAAAASNPSQGGMFDRDTPPSSGARQNTPERSPSP